MPSRRWAIPCCAALAVALAGCGDDRAEAPDAPLSVDLSGDWAGTWSGQNGPQGYVTGTWEASVTQTASGITGTLVLGGDVDCPDGVVAGGAGQDGLVHGTIERAGCNPHQWTLTALDLAARTMSGAWTQPALGGSGTFTGRQVAKRGGPHVSFFAPPGGPPGTLVTIVGRGFVPSATLVELDGLPATVTTVTSEKAVARVPPGASSAAIVVTTPYGTAMSARPFDAGPGFPRPTTNTAFTAGANPEGIVIGPDGRRAYVASRGNGTVTMRDLRASYTFSPATPVDPLDVAPARGVAASPDGRRIYVASGPSGVTVLDTALNVVVDALAVPAGAGDGPNPQGIAVSPDGRTLYVSDDRDGGAASVVDLATRSVVASLSRGPGTAPQGIAVSPDGRTAYVAFRGADVLDVFDAEANATVASVAMPAGPAGVAVSPDGARVWVGSATAGTVTLVAAETLSPVATVPVGGAPAALALSPDGSRLYVANRASRSVSVIATLTASLETTIGEVCYEPTGLGMSPDGKRVLVTCGADPRVVEIGGPFTLTIVKAGSGFGTVTSSPGGVLCGPACQARFDPGTLVTLAAVTDSNSRFDGWSGDCSADGSVSMTENRVCTATFTNPNLGGSGGGGGGGGGTGGGYGSSYGYCMAITALHGGDRAGDIELLRAFRDRRLLPTAAGRALVRAYWAVSPPIARALARHEPLRAGARAALAPVVWAIERPRDAGLALGAAFGLLLVACRLGARRRS